MEIQSLLLPRFCTSSPPTASRSGIGWLPKPGVFNRTGQTPPQITMGSSKPASNSLPIPSVSKPVRHFEHLWQRQDVAALLHAEVAAMNVENFIVRAKRRLVEKYSKPESWGVLKEDAFVELAHEVAGLPSELDPEDEEAKRFDLLMLHLQLAVLRAEPAFKRLSEQVKAIAGLLEEKSSIPMVREQMELIQAVQTDEWWENVTTPMLETVRRRLRALVKLIDKQQRKPIYTNFEDEIGDESPVELPGFATPDSYERFRAKSLPRVVTSSSCIATTIFFFVFWGVKEIVFAFWSILPQVRLAASVIPAKNLQYWIHGMSPSRLVPSVRSELWLQPPWSIHASWQALLPSPNCRQWPGPFCGRCKVCSVIGFFAI